MLFRNIIITTIIDGKRLHIHINLNIQGAPPSRRGVHVLKAKSAEAPHTRCAYQALVLNLFP